MRNRLHKKGKEALSSVGGEGLPLGVVLDEEVPEKKKAPYLAERGKTSLLYLEEKPLPNLRRVETNLHFRSEKGGDR